MPNHQRDNAEKPVSLPDHGCIWPAPQGNRVANQIVVPLWRIQEKSPFAADERCSQRLFSKPVIEPCIGDAEQLIAGRSCTETPIRVHMFNEKPFIEGADSLQRLK